MLSEEEIKEKNKDTVKYIRWGTKVLQIILDGLNEITDDDKFMKELFEVTSKICRLSEVIYDNCNRLDVSKQILEEDN